MHKRDALWGVDEVGVLSLIKGKYMFMTLFCTGFVEVLDRAESIVTEGPVSPVSPLGPQHFDIISLVNEGKHKWLT